MKSIILPVFGSTRTPLEPCTSRPRSAGVIERNSCAKNPSNYHRCQPLGADFRSRPSHSGIRVIEIYPRPENGQRRGKSARELKTARTGHYPMESYSRAKRPLKEIIRRFFPWPGLTVVAVLGFNDGHPVKQSSPSAAKFGSVLRDVPGAIRPGGIAFKSNYRLPR